MGVGSWLIGWWLGSEELGCSLVYTSAIAKGSPSQLRLLLLTQFAVSKHQPSNIDKASREVKLNGAPECVSRDCINLFALLHFSLLLLLRLCFRTHVSAPYILETLLSPDMICDMRARSF